MRNDSSKTDRKKIIAIAAAAGVGVCAIAGMMVGIKTGKLSIPNGLPHIKLTRHPRGTERGILLQGGKDIQAAGRDVVEKLATVDLTGARKVARDIGGSMGVSAQEVNRRLVDCKLATRKPYGLELTETGKRFGKLATKTRARGHTFGNIEWDEAIKPIIFSKEEMAEHERKMALVAKIMSQFRDE